MNALDRLKARLQLAQTHSQRTDETDKTGSVSSGSFVSPRSATVEEGSVSSVGAFPSGPQKLKRAVNDGGEIALDPGGYPLKHCPACGGRLFWKSAVEIPAGPGWRCRACELPDGLYHGCGLPPDSAQNGPATRSRNAQEYDSHPGRPGVPSAIATLPDVPPWTDDRVWIDRWRKAGALADRRPVLEAWLAAAPPQPLPRCLASVELARLAREHGVEVELPNSPPARRGGPQDDRVGPSRSEGPLAASAVPQDDGPLLETSDPVTTPAGRCRCCRWIPPLNARAACWACEREGRG
jgi:hypothetical protein